MYYPVYNRLTSFFVQLSVLFVFVCPSSVGRFHLRIASIDRSKEYRERSIVNGKKRKKRKEFGVGIEPRRKSWPSFLEERTTFVRELRYSTMTILHSLARSQLTQGNTCSRLAGHDRCHCSQAFDQVCIRESPYNVPMLTLPKTQQSREDTFSRTKRRLKIANLTKLPRKKKEVEEKKRERKKGKEDENNPISYFPESLDFFRFARYKLGN